jgi:hypothetical protein
MKNSVFWDVHHVALVRTDVSEELSASIIRATRLGELGTLAVTSSRRTQRDYVVLSSPILVTLMMEAIRSSETSASTRAIRRNDREDGILQSKTSSHGFKLASYSGESCSVAGVLLSDGAG